MLALDHFTGLDYQFPALYVIPVCLAAWYSGRWAALGLAVAVPIMRLGLVFGDTQLPSQTVFATCFRGVVIMVLSLWFARLAQLERELYTRVRVLEGLLPICSFCKNIRNEGGDWERFESFITNRSEAEFTHGLCPHCAAEHYPGLVDIA